LRDDCALGLVIELNYAKAVVRIEGKVVASEVMANHEHLYGLKLLRA
jgi:hypothetical protein